MNKGWETKEGENQPRLKMLSILEPSPKIFLDQSLNLVPCNAFVSNEIARKVIQGLKYSRLFIIKIIIIC